MTKLSDKILKLSNQNLSEASVLDIGCIGGTLEKTTPTKLHPSIKKRVSKITGLDLDKRGVDILNEQGYTIKYADAQKFDLGTKYDIIVASNIIEHLMNLDGFMKSILKHSANSTRIIIVTPNAYSFINFLGILITGTRRICEEHVHWHSIQTIESIAARYDLEITGIDYYTDVGGNLLNKIVTMITKIISIFRPQFNDSIIISLSKKS